MLVKDYHTHIITFSYETPGLLVSKTRNFVEQGSVPICICKEEVDRIEKDIENSNKFYIKVQNKEWQGRKGNALQNPYISYRTIRNRSFDDRDDEVKRNDEYFSYLLNAIDISDEFEDTLDWINLTIRRIEKIDKRKNYSTH